MKESGKMINKMGKAHLNGAMELNIQDNGRMEL